MSIESQLTSYISTELLDSRQTVAADDRLLADGLVDSLGMMRLVAFIHESFGYEIPPQDVVIENFSTVAKVVDYLRSRGV